MKPLIFILFILCTVWSFLMYPGTQNAVHMDRGNWMDPSVMIAEGQSLLHEGDLVVRLHRDPTSRYIQFFNRHDKSYSHSGIVLFEHGYPYVFHIVNGEENVDEKLRKDSLNRFCNPRKNMAYGIFRYQMNAAEIKILKDWIHKWYEEGVRFDPTFNLNTDDRMYCSEMIRKALIRATANRISIETTKLTTIEARLFSGYAHLPFSYTNNLSVVAIDDLYVNPYCHLVQEYTY